MSGGRKASIATNRFLPCLNFHVYQFSDILHLLAFIISLNIYKNDVKGNRYFFRGGNYVSIVVVSHLKGVYIKMKEFWKVFGVQKRKYEVTKRENSWRSSE